MNVQKVSDVMNVGEIWMSEWDVDWRVLEVHERYAVVKRTEPRARSRHNVYMTEIQNWERVKPAEAAALREP